MRIVHLTHTDIRYDNRILKELECLKMNCDFDLCGIGINYNEGSAINDTSLLTNNLIAITLRTKRIKFIPRSIKHILVFIELLFKSFFITIKLKPAIIHCHDTLVLPIAFTYKLIYSKSKIIYDAHELESDKNGQSALLRLGTLLIERIAWFKIDYLITVSPSIKEWYITKFGAKPSEIILNSPKIGHNSFEGTNEMVENNKYFHDLYNIDYHLKVFVYLGALVPGRYIEQLLTIFTKENINSVIVFVGYGSLERQIKEFAQKSNKIKLHDPVPHDKVVETIKSADIGLCLIENVSLSDYYSLPNKLFEYTFARKMVLASNFPDIRKLVNEYNLGRCCNLDVDSIKKSIIEFENDLSTTVKSNIYELSWEAQELRLINIYRNII